MVFLGYRIIIKRLGGNPMINKMILGAVRRNKSVCHLSASYTVDGYFFLRDPIKKLGRYWP